MSTLMVSLDLDDTWAYLRARRDPAYRQAPSILPLATERLIDLLDLARIETATAFVVGHDARQPTGARAIRALAARGLEIADHSDGHRGELARLPAEAIHADLAASRDAQAQITGRAPAGFRCPSFGRSPALSAAVRELRYDYDASLLPTVLVPVLRAVHRARAGAGPSQATYGTLAEAFAPLAPTEHDGVTEVPTTTIPVVRLPFHGTYLAAACAISPRLADGYLRLADITCRLARVPVSFLLHPTDVLDADDVPALADFPGMRVPWQRKQQVMVGALTRLRHERGVRTIGTQTGVRR